MDEPLQQHARSVPTPSGRPGVVGWLVAAGAAAVALAMQPPLPGGSTGLYLHSVAVKALVLWISCFSALGLAALGIARGRVRTRWSLPLSLAVAFVLWSCVATVLSPSPWTALFGQRWRLEGLMSVAAYAVAFFIAIQTCRTWTSVHRLLRPAAIAAGVVAAYGLVQTAGLDPLSWPGLMWGARRAFSTMGNPDTFGAFCALFAFVSAGLAVSAVGSWSRRVLWASAGLCSAGVVFSFSRGAWIGFIVGSVVVLASRSWRASPDARRVAAAAIAATVLFAGAAVAMRGSADPDSDVVRRIASAVDLSDRNTAARLVMWQLGIDGVAASPLWGHGPDGFLSVFEPRKPAHYVKLVSENVVQESAHNVAIEIAVGSGAVGLALWVALVAAVLVGAVKHAAAYADRSPAASASVRLMVVGVLSCLVALLFVPTGPGLMLPFWVVMGALAAPYAREVESLTLASRAGAWAAVAAGLAAVVLALLFGSADASAAKAADKRVVTERRLAAADRATALLPMYAEHQAVAAKARADALVQAGSTGSMRIEDAVALRDAMLAHARRAVELEPRDPQRRVLLASLLLLGNSVDGSTLDEAATEIRAARKLSPNDLMAMYWQARVLRAQGDLASAERVLREALALRPGYVKAALLMSDLLVEGGKPSEARAVLEAARRQSDDPALVQALAKLGAPSGK